MFELTPFSGELFLKKRGLGKITGLVAGAFLSLVGSAKAEPYDDRIHLDTVTRTRVQRRVPKEWYVLERDPGDDDSPEYRIGLGWHNHRPACGCTDCIRSHDSMPSLLSVNEIKLSFDNAAGLALNYVTHETGASDNTAGRVVHLGALIGVMSLTSHLAHEHAHHTAPHRQTGAVTLEDYLQGLPTYAEYIDRHAAGLNNSELLFHRYSDHAATSSLNLVNSVGIVMSKMDAFIQWVYSFHYNGRELDRRRTVALGAVYRREGHGVTDPIMPQVNDLVGLGDNRAYTNLLSLSGPASKEEDLLMSAASTALSASFWQSLTLPIRYIANGTQSEELWHIPAGEVKLYFPNFSVYRLPEGYFGQAKMFVGFPESDALLSLRAAMGIGRRRNMIDDRLAGLGIHNFEPVDGVRLSAEAYVIANGGHVSGYGAFGRVSVELTDNFSVFAEARYDFNSPLMRPGSSDESLFIVGGVEVTQSSRP